MTIEFVNHPIDWNENQIKIISKVDELKNEEWL